LSSALRERESWSALWPSQQLLCRVGAEPEIQFFESPVIVDNKSGEIIAR
jgi:hypothetical protein